MLGGIHCGMAFRHGIMIVSLAGPEVISLRVEKSCNKRWLCL